MSFSAEIVTKFRLILVTSEILHLLVILQYWFQKIAIDKFPKMS